MANTPGEHNNEDPLANRGEDKGDKVARKEEFRQQAREQKSEAKWFTPEPREEASTDIPTEPSKPYAGAEMKQGEGSAAALDAGGSSQKGDKARSVETDRFADRLEAGQEGNSGLGADPSLLQNRDADSRDVTHLGSAPYQGTGEGRSEGAGAEPGEPESGPVGQPRHTQHAGTHEDERVRETGHGMGSEQLADRDQGQPGRTAKGERPRGTQDQPLPQGSAETGRDAQQAGNYGMGEETGIRQSAESTEDRRERQAREAGADTRGMEQQGKNEGPNAKQTLRDGAGDDTPRH